MKIAILGAGLMGRVLAMRFYQEGFINLTLIDKDNTINSTSPAMIAAGMLASLSESIMGGKLIYQLGRESIILWKKYLFNLNVKDLLNDKGTILIAHANFYKEIMHYIAKINFNTGLDNQYQLLTKLQLNSLEPELAFNHAYFLPEEGMLNAQKVMIAMGEYLSDRVKWQTNSVVTKINTTGDIIVNEKKEHFQLVIDCRGMGAKAIYPDLRGVRGEIIRVYAKEVNLTRAVRLFHPRHNIYIAPLPDNNYLIGATEIETTDYSPISVRSTLELLTSAYSVHSGFAEARIVSFASNCRPTLTDNLPQIKKQDCLIAINGLYRHGFLLAPSLAEELVTYLNNGTKQFSQIWR